MEKALLESKRKHPPLEPFDDQTGFSRATVGGVPGAGDLVPAPGQRQQTATSLAVKTQTKPLPFTLTFAARTSAKSFLTCSLTRTKLALGSFLGRSNGSVQRHNSAWELAKEETLLIYVVDDLPRLTDLYTRLLGATYIVETFNDRTKALESLQADCRTPALLITDYLGFSVPINHFIQSCRRIHPSLRILMASGFNKSEMRFLGTKPDHFIQKPFTSDEFQRAVEEVLSA
jgi:hypothetical protein